MTNLQQNRELLAARTRRTRGLGATLVAVCVFCSASALCAAPPEDEEMHVVAHKHGDTITVETSAYVPVTPEEAWAVLTDFDHLAGVIEGMEMSKIVGHSGDKLLVQQRGQASRGPLTFSFESLREIELKPYTEMRGHLISGSMKKSDGVTRLAPEGEGTRITSSGEFIPDIWVPPFIGVKIIEMETRKQFAGLRQEIMRRKQLRVGLDQSATPPPVR